MGKSKYSRSDDHKVEVPPDWKPEPFTQECNPKGCFEESRFAQLFPRYREEYIRSVWPMVKAKLAEHEIVAELDAIEGTMTVRTIKNKTWDPMIILKARDLINLLARSVPVDQAFHCLEDDVFVDIIKIRSLVPKLERFVRRRQRLIGPDGITLKAIEVVTECYVLVQGSTVSAIGPYSRLKEVRKIVVDCMNNIHPFRNIVELRIKRDLSNHPELKDQSWDRFLPKFKKQNTNKRMKPLVVKKKKEYTPFPPPQLERKVDKELETGEYFLKEKERHNKKLEAKKEKQQQNAKESKRKRDEAFIPPEEPVYIEKMEITTESS